MQTPPIAVEITRGDTVESVHRVHLVVSDASGNVVTSLGDPEFVVFTRSAAKPFQAVPLITSGAAEAFGLNEQELALACGSHGGEPMHTKLALGMLAKAGLDAAALQCGTHGPRTDAARKGLAGARMTAAHHNCSGKHAALLLMQKHLGGDVATYMQPDAPCQRAVREAIAHIAGVAPESIRVGTDGCGVPNFAVPLRVLAQMTARLAMPQGVDKPTTDALSRLSRAMLLYPELVAGTDLFDTDLIGASEERLIAKAGAEGVQVVGDLASGMGLALKIEDGALRGVAPTTIEALRQLAWLESRAFEVLGDWWMPAVKNAAGAAVGRIKPAIELPGLGGGLHG